MTFAGDLDLEVAAGGRGIEGPAQGLETVEGGASEVAAVSEATDEAEAEIVAEAGAAIGEADPEEAAAGRDDTGPDRGLVIEAGGEDLRGADMAIGVG